MNALKIKKFLFSNKNIVGCMIASVLLILALTGILKSYWLPIVIMGYIFGYVAGPAEKQIKFYHFKNENFHDYVGFVKKMSATVEQSQKLPTEAKASIHKIAQCGNELLTFLQTSDKNYTLNEDLMNFTAIFDAYLPKIINQYERLPTTYANEVKSSNGKTAKEMLMEQLRVLERKVEEIAYGMYEDDVTALRANGNFLKEKFGSDKNLFEIHNQHMNGK